MSKTRPCEKCITCGKRFTSANYGAHGLCKSCYNKENKKQRRNNPNDAYAENERQRAKIYYHSIGQQRRDEFLNEFKTPCLKCGESEFSCIAFHHVDPATKAFCVGDGTLKYSKEAVVSEIKKCVCLCENCHRKFHHIYGYHIENAKQKLEAYIGKSL